MRCVQCAEIHSLQPDFDVLLKKVDQVLKCAEEAAECEADGAEGGAAGEAATESVCRNWPPGEG